MNRRKSGVKVFCWFLCGCALYFWKIPFFFFIKQDDQVVNVGALFFILTER